MIGPDSPLLELREVGRTFGRCHALSDVRLSIRAGETVVLFGANGAGKTTLIRIAATLLAPTSGCLLHMGRRLTGASRPAYRRRLGLVGHATFLYDDLTAAENLLLHARLRGVARPAERVSGLLQRVGLAARSSEPVGTFSRGMQQRAALARALVDTPDLLLLDEPFSGLDASATAALVGLLREHNARGGATLLSTHDLAGGVALADRYAMLQGGRLHAAGTCAPLRAVPAPSLESALRAGGTS